MEDLVMEWERLSDQLMACSGCNPSICGITLDLEDVSWGVSEIKSKLSNH